MDLDNANMASEGESPIRRQRYPQGYIGRRAYSGHYAEQA